MKLSFKAYMSHTCINGMNLALYAARSGACEVRAENVLSGEVFWVRRFESTSDAADWYESIDGSGVGKLLNAINSTKGV